MFRPTILLALLGVCLAGRRYGSSYCFQCQYTAPREQTRLEYEIEEYEEKIPTTKVHCWFKYEFQGEASEIAGRPENDCGYTKPRCEHETVYEVIKKTRKVPKVVKDVTPGSGAMACTGPLRPKVKGDGVKEMECYSPCFTKSNALGDVVRGCYADEVPAAPDVDGCQSYGGYTYCWCGGSHCNGDSI